MSVECEEYSSFTVTTTATTETGLSFNGCYEYSLVSANGNGLPWYTMDGALVEYQLLVYGTTAYSDEHEVWAFGRLDETAEDNESSAKFCHDSDEQDASTLHPSGVTEWTCDDEFEAIYFSCDCLTPAPVSPASETPPTPSVASTTSSNGVATAAIAGGVVGAVLVVAAAVILVILVTTGRLKISKCCSPEASAAQYPEGVQSAPSVSANPPPYEGTLRDQYPAPVDNPRVK